jgi:hypothetical protein
VAQERKQNHRRLRKIDAAMHKALKGDRSQVGRYCIDMLKAKEDDNRRKHQPGHSR